MLPPDTLFLRGLGGDMLAPRHHDDGRQGADDAGTWLYHCHVIDHIAAGMLAKYTFSPEPVGVRLERQGTSALPSVLDAIAAPWPCCCVEVERSAHQS